MEVGTSVTYARGCQSKFLSLDICDDFISQVCGTLDSRTVRKYVMHVREICLYHYGYVVLARRRAAIQFCFNENFCLTVCQE